MSRYGSVAITGPASVVTRVAQGSTAEALQASVAEAMASLPPGYIIVDISLTGSGHGRRWMVTIEAGAPGDTTGGFAVPPTLTFFLGVNTPSVLAERMAAAPVAGVLADSQIAGSSHGDAYMGMLVQGTISGGGGGTCAPLSNVFYVDGGTTTPLPDQDGAICTPFETITQALVAVGALAGASGTIVVTPGTYDEDLSIPADKSVAIRGLGEVELGTGAPARNVTWATDGGVLFLEFVHVTGDVSISDNGAPAGAIFLFHGPADIDGDVDATAYSGGIELAFVNQTAPGAGNVIGDVIAPTATLVGAERRFVGDVTVHAYERLVGCNFGGDFTVVGAGGGPVATGGFFRCSFIDVGGGPPPVFTGLGAGSFRLDGVSEYNFEFVDGVLAGPGGNATYDRIDDPMMRSVVVAADFTADAPNRVVVVTGVLPPAVPGPPRTITLPPSPRIDDEFIVKDRTGAGAGASVATPIRVDGNGNAIDGTATRDLATAYGSFHLKFTGEWSLI